MAWKFQFMKSAAGTSVAYQDVGRGNALFVFPGWALTTEPVPDEVEARALWQRLSEGRRLVTLAWDPPRGSAASSLERQAGLAVELADYLGIERFDVLGFIEGAAAAIACAACFPARVSRLAVYNAYPCGNAIGSPAAVSAFVELVRTNWPVATRAVANLIYPDGPIEAQRAATQRLRSRLTPDGLAESIEFMYAVDVRPLLPAVRAPTLVIHREGPGEEPVVPRVQGERTAAAIAGAEFLAIAGGNSGCPEYQHETYLEALDGFLASGAAPALDGHGLTPRQVEVVRLLALGESNREIAARLCLSPATVDRHLRDIFARTGTTNRTQAALFAVRQNLA